MESTKSLKIYVIGDPHFKSKNALETNEMVTKIYTSIIEEKPDFIVVLGDVLDTHETIHVGPLCRATEFLFQLSKMSKHLFVLVGNHDMKSNAEFLTGESAFNACKSWPNATVVDKVIKHTFGDRHFVFLPYVPTGRLSEALLTEHITSENISMFDIVFAHQEFKGCNMGMITSNEGDPWDLSAPLCISGHIHDYQVLQPNLIYPGTPIQHGYGDNPNKAIMILEQDDSNPVKYSYRRINLNLPKKLTVHITSEELVDYVLPENSFVKLIVTGESDKVREIMKLDKVKTLISSERIKLSIQEIKKKKNELNVTASLLAEVMSTQFVPFQERLKKVIGGEVVEVQDVFKKLFGDI